MLLGRYNSVDPARRDDEWVGCAFFCQSAGSEQVKTISLRCSSESRPQAIRRITRICLFRPSTKATETLFNLVRKTRKVRPDSFGSRERPITLVPAVNASRHRAH